MKKLIYILLLFPAFQLQSQIPTEGLVAYYELDKNAFDSSRNMNAGKIIGPIVGRENRFGHEDKALFFNGTTNYVEIVDSTALNLTQAISISLWIKPISINPDAWICLANKWEDVPGPGGKGYYLGINPDGTLVRWNTGSVNIDGNKVNINEWVNIVATYDSDSIKIYSNSVLESTTPAIDFIEPTIIKFRLGLQSEVFEGTANYHGLMDEILIYNRALTDMEISQIYTSTPTSIEDSQENKFMVFPNPFKEFITIKSHNPNITHGEILDIEGRLVKKVEINNTTQRFSLENLQNGLYILNLYSEKGFIGSKKLIKSLN